LGLGFIRDRERAGIEAAKTKGVYKGWPVKLDWGLIGLTQISKEIGCSRGMVYKVLYGPQKAH
jgi:DNA invertase Pin-like site-specific DNA recombinase